MRTRYLLLAPLLLLEQGACVSDRLQLMESRIHWLQQKEQTHAQTIDIIKSQMTDGLTLALCTPELKQLLEDVNKECTLASKRDFGVRVKFNPVREVLDGKRVVVVDDSIVRGTTSKALVNLVKNAMQAMTRDGTLTLQTGANDEAVWVSVADTGGGIPQEQINRIFEPFYTTKKKGTGLGLMIVQRIVRAHNGRIELDSHVGRGTTFRLWLPLQEKKPRLLQAPAHN